MNRYISLGLLAASIALIPTVCNKKVFGTSESNTHQSNQANVSTSQGFASIQTRNKRIAMNVDKTYSIYSKDGKVLAENMTLEELETNKPELHEIIKRSIYKPTLMMDASIGIGRDSNFK